MTDDAANGEPIDDPTARARALTSLLVEREIVSIDAIDEVISRYETDVGPMNGAEVVARAWSDEAYRERLLEDGTAGIAELGHTGLEGADIEVVANASDRHNVIVCTLCSCYPWSVLGLPPTWYKTPAYRSKIVKRPRETLRDSFGLDLDSGVEIRVHDSTSEMRYMVLPRRPENAEELDESDLAGLVTRNSMIGVERLGGRTVEELQEATP